ncbi:MAG: hypothetical protein HQK79_22075 [Desulfobacterales bacterium]|nr:hypothetical protein [Desulfobacterales bacterium]
MITIFYQDKLNQDRRKKCQIILKIKQKLGGKLCELCASTIKFLKKNIFLEEFISRHRNLDKNFIRDRLLPFSTLIFFLINLIKDSLQDEVDYFFKALGNLDIAIRKVTKKVFCKARKILKYQAFVELYEALIEFFYKHFPYRTWHGLRVIASDGSTIKVSKTQPVADHFDSLTHVQGEPCPLARISFLFDLLNKLKLRAIISPHENGERNLLAQHIKNNIMGIKDLLLLDRGYPAFWLFVLIFLQWELIFVPE